MLKRPFAIVAIVASVAAAMWVSYGWFSGSDNPEPESATAYLEDATSHVATAPVATPTAFNNAATNHTPLTAVSLSPPLFDPATAKTFIDLLRQYPSGALTPEDKHVMEQAIRDWNDSQAGRAFIVDTLFSAEEPALAATLHSVILDADLKDPALIVALINRDQTEASTQFKTQIIDLIADLNTQSSAPFSAEIESYLSQLANHPEAPLREAAISQHAWYSVNHPEGQHAIISSYLLDASPNVRREMFELIEIRASDPDFQGRADLALTLHSLNQADYLNVSPQEDARIAEVLRKLATSRLN